MKKLMKILAVCAAVALLLLAFSGTVQAKTVIERGTHDFDYLEVFPAGDRCDFEVTAHHYGSYRFESSEDKDGLGALRITEGQYRVDYYYTPERTLRGRVQGPLLIQNLDDGILIKINGADFLIIVPGYGPVYGAAGLNLFKITFDPETGDVQFDYLKDSGLRFYWDNEANLEAFCNYLKPE